MSSSNFSSRENKGLLWKLMYENGIFQDIPSELITNVKNILDNEVANIENTSGTVLEKNKLVMKGVVNKLIPLRSNGPNLSIRRPVTADELSKIRQDTLGKDLELRQKEFEELLSIKQPDSIDFSILNADKPIGSDMNKIIEDTKSRRARDLEQVIAQKWISSESATKKWLTSESVTENKNDYNIITRQYIQPSSGNTNNHNVARLKIGETLNDLTFTPVAVAPVAVKRVTFNEEPTMVSDQQYYSTDNIVEKIKILMTEIREKSHKVDELLAQIHYINEDERHDNTKDNTENNTEDN